MPVPSGEARIGWLAGLTVALLLIAAGALRFQGLTEPLPTFHPLRHYRSALIARACYYEATPSTPEWAVAIARANRDIQQAGEPPIMEWLACTAYRAIGEERLAIPRALSALWWMAAAVAVYRLGRRLISPRGALFATTLCLFLPYAIVATRTFQPDPLMSACVMWAVLALVQWHDRPTRGRLIIAASIAGLALLVKPMSVFIVVPAMWAVSRARTKRATDRRAPVLVIAALALVPPALFYGGSLLFSSLADDQLKTRFVPSLLVTDFFWQGLARQASQVYGVLMVVAAVAGSAIAEERLLRRLLLAVWFGYAAFAVAFTYHVPTHDYYHLPFLPVAALAAAAGMERLWKGLRVRPRVASAVTGALAILVMWQGAAAAQPHLRRADARAVVADYERIGRVIDHSNKVIFLDPGYGYPLMYHAEIAGDAWPGIDDLEAERLDGRAARSAIDRFTEDYVEPNFFVVTDLVSLEAQPDLQALLTARATLVDETLRHRVYRFESDER
jgi:4-amino-4-deoxy-L-arabinose transferase-like glycosyltransferase